MNIKLKYPQKFKKQHKARFVYDMTSDINFNLQLQPISQQPSVNFLKIYFSQNIILPKRTISFLRKVLRKFLKKKRINCWFNIQPNKIITSKSKNSRMGRGVGTINRTAFKISSKKPFLILNNISVLRTKYLMSFLSARLPISLVMKL